MVDQVLDTKTANGADARTRLDVELDHDSRDDSPIGHRVTTLSVRIGVRSSPEIVAKGSQETVASIDAGTHSIVELRSSTDDPNHELADHQRLASRKSGVARLISMAH